MAVDMEEDTEDTEVEEDGLLSVAEEVVAGDGGPLNGGPGTENPLF